jgi:hypothetical protein
MKEPTMTDPEREHFLGRIRELEHSRGRWRLTALVLGALLLLPVICGGLVGVVWAPRLERQRAEEAERARYFEIVRDTEQELLNAESERHDAERQQAEQGKEEARKDKE